MDKIEKVKIEKRFDFVNNKHIVDLTLFRREVNEDQFCWLPILAGTGVVEIDCTSDERTYSRRVSATTLELLLSKVEAVQNSIVKFVREFNKKIDNLPADQSITINFLDDEISVTDEKIV